MGFTYWLWLPTNLIDLWIGAFPLFCEIIVPFDTTGPPFKFHSFIVFGAFTSAGDDLDCPQSHETSKHSVLNLSQVSGLRMTNML